MRPYKTMLHFFRFKPHTVVLGVSLFLGMTNSFPVKMPSLEDQTKMQECNAIRECRNRVSMLSQCLKVSNSDLLFENFILFKTLFAIDLNIFEAFEHRRLLAFEETPEEKVRQQEFIESVEKVIDYNKDTKKISFDRSEKNLSFFLNSKILSDYSNIFIILFNEILKSKITDSPPIFIFYKNLNNFISILEAISESVEKLDGARHYSLVTEARDFKQHFKSIFLGIDQHVENEYFDLIFRSYNVYEILCSLMEFYCDLLNPNLDFKDIGEAKRALNNCCNFYYHRILWNLKIKFSLEEVHYCVNVGIKKYIIGSSIFATYVLKTIKFLKEYLYEIIFLKSNYNENLTHNTSEEAQ